MALGYPWNHVPNPHERVKTFIYPYLDSGKIVGIEDRTLIKFHLSKMSLEQSLKFKVRGDAA